MSGGLEDEVKEVLEAFVDSPQYRLGVESWQLSTVAGGIDVENGSPLDMRGALELVHAMVRQLVLMGYCVIQGGVVDPMATISWDSKKREWVAPVQDESDPPTICVFMAPLVHSNGTSLMSYGSAALRVWHNLSAITENMRRRDAFNSRHTVFTSVNPAVTPGDSLTPSFIAARGRAVGTAEPDFTTPDRRHELLGDLMRRSNGLRSHGDIFMAGQGFPVDSSAPKVHSEHFVTDGMTSVGEARHLQAPVADMNRLVKHYVHSFYQALGVPPQKLGENVNSERLAGSEMISSEALWTHEARVRDVRDVVNDALKVLGISLRPSVRYRVLVQHPELFDPEKYTDLLAHSLGVPTEYVASGPVPMETDTRHPPTSDLRTIKEPSEQLDRGEQRVPEEKKEPKAE